MKAVLSWLLLVALLTHTGAHFTIVVRFALTREWRKAGLAFLLPPFAPLYGWRSGMRVPVYAWTGALAAYALGVAAASW